MLISNLSETTVFEVLPYAISVLKKAGYQLVTLAECLGENPYQNIAAPQVVRICPRRIGHQNSDLGLCARVHGPVELGHFLDVGSDIYHGLCRTNTAFLHGTSLHRNIFTVLRPPQTTFSFSRQVLIKGFVACI
jgi:hypothetical protein